MSATRRKPLLGRLGSITALILVAGTVAEQAQALATAPVRSKQRLVSCGQASAPGTPYSAFVMRASGMSCRSARAVLLAWAHHPSRPSAGIPGWRCRATANGAPWFFYVKSIGARTLIAEAFRLHARHASPRRVLSPSASGSAPQPDSPWPYARYFPLSGPEGGGCTSWAYYKRPDIMNAILANWPVVAEHVTTNNSGGGAASWAEDAPYVGYAVDGSPAAHDIAVWPAGVEQAGELGHVAYVEAVNPDGSIFISEMNSVGTATITTEVAEPPEAPVSITYDTRTIAAAQVSEDIEHGLRFIHQR
jgi:surface antigen